MPIDEHMSQDLPKKFERNRSARTEVISEKPIVGYHRVPCRVEGTKLKLLSHLKGNLYVIKGEEFKFRFSFNQRVSVFASKPIRAV